MYTKRFHIATADGIHFYLYQHGTLITMGSISCLRRAARYTWLPEWSSI